MGLIPDTKPGKLQFCDNHVSAWTANAVGMGSSTAAVSDWNTKLTAAHTAFDAQQAAATTAKDATNTCNLAMQTLMDATASIIKAVGSKAKVSGDSIYTLASLPIPATPSPIAPPGKPTDLGVDLDEDGNLRLTWKCENPAGSTGTLYQVWRQVDGGTLDYLGGAGDRKFIDNTLPAGAALVMYKIQAVRTTAIGLPATFNVKFGSAAGGAFATVEETTPIKKAA